MIAVIDYDTGNLNSIENALHRLGVDYKLTRSKSEIVSASHVILPGVGAAGAAMRKIDSYNLRDVICELKQPTLGICLGMQLMCSFSEEDNVDTIGIFDNVVKLFEPKVDLKVPHMGWNSINNLSTNLFKDVKEGSFVYYVHSYGANVNQNTIATTNHGVDFSGSLNKDNFFGCQFHPEKSGIVGEKIISNFLKEV